MDSNITPDERFFFRERAEALVLYNELRSKLFAVLPDTALRIQKTQIGFYRRHLFGAVSFLPVRKGKPRPKNFITVTCGLNRRLESPRIDAAVEPYPGRWTHHIMISSPQELDLELMGWLLEAAEFAASKQ